MEELKPCDCEEWEKYGQLIWAAQMVRLTHPHLAPEYPAEGVFLYCPWCGSKRIAQNKTKED